MYVCDVSELCVCLWCERVLSVCGVRELCVFVV